MSQYGTGRMTVSQPTGRTATGYPYCIHSLDFRRLRLVLSSEFLTYLLTYLLRSVFRNQNTVLSTEDGWLLSAIVAVRLNAS